MGKWYERYIYRDRKAEVRSAAFPWESESDTPSAQAGHAMQLGKVIKKENGKVTMRENGKVGKWKSGKMGKWKSGKVEKWESWIRSLETATVIAMRHSPS